MSDSLPPMPMPGQLNMLTRAALQAQVFLLKRDWAGPMGDFVMVMTHRGRKSGKLYSTPIAYLRDGDSILAITSGHRQSNWYRNVMAAGEATINIHGTEKRVRVVELENPEEVARVFQTFQKSYKGFERAFKCKPDAPEHILKLARDRMTYLRMTPV